MKTSKALKSFSILILLLPLFFPSFISADENDTAGVTMNVPSICKLTINDSDQIIDLLEDASGEAAYEAGFIDGASNQPILIVDSNTSWKMSVAVMFDWDLVDSYQKATGDLMLKVTSSSGHQTGFNAFTALSLDDQEIASFGEGVGDDTYKCRYRIKLSWDKDIPGVYIIIITYTLSTEPI